jgi:glycosyltransferase involved in cell wall biosynthesis
VRVVVVSGIWPPDVGGPASHAPAVADFLVARGHDVEVVTTATASPPERAYPVHWVSRTLPRGARHVKAVSVIRARAARSDVVYTTGLFGRSAAGATLARRPFVLKLTADPAFERAWRRGLIGGSVDSFQEGGGGPSVRLLRRLRDAELRHAAHVFTPSAWLRELVVSWGVPPERVSVLPNPAPAIDGLASKQELRDRHGLAGPTLAFAGRLTPQKALGQAIWSVATAGGIALLVVGDGPDRPRLERLAAELGVADDVRFLGAQPRERVLELLRAADGAVLTSDWENFPHTVVEALAVGTPVVATAVGGVPEVVHDGENGLLVPPGDRDAFAEAIRRFVDDDGLRARLAAAAALSVEPYAAELLFARVEEELARAAAS